MQKPKGYPVAIFRDPDQKFLCVYCCCVLRNPIQSYCGHRFCKDCIDYIINHEDSRICPNCRAEGGDLEFSSLTLDQTFPDNAIKREFNSMQASCPFDDCSWSGSFKDFETHFITCEHRELECECGAKYPHSRQRHHLQNECPLRRIHCPHCNAGLIFKELDEHYNQCSSFPIQCEVCKELIPRAELQLHESKHANVVGGPCKACGKTITEESIDRHFERDIAGHFNIVYSRVNQLETSVGLTSSSAATQESLINRVSRLENRLQSVLEQQQGVSVLQRGQSAAAAGSSGGEPQAASAGPQVTPAVVHTLNIYENVLTVLNREVEKLTLQLNSMEVQRRQDREQLDTMDRKLKTLERQLALKDVTISELDLRIAALEQTSYDGTLLWRISDFARRRQEAISGRTTSIYSPAFYTSKTGYKMCARLYLNGDGMGKGTHVSLFFVVMRGQHDALLKWPFRQKVTLMFLEQSGKEHVVDAFRPDPTSSSFKRPSTEMNIASGCPLFMSLSMFDSATNAFVKDNTAFLKIIVSCEGLN